MTCKYSAILYKDLSIHGLGHLGGSWNQSPAATKEQLTVVFAFSAPYASAPLLFAVCGMFMCPLKFTC
jgi:hypothetical protein